MRVKIGHLWFQPLAGAPVMIELSEPEKALIANTDSHKTKFAFFADEERRKQWVSK